MGRLKGIVARLGAMLRPERAERRLEEELAFHLEMEAERLRAQGYSADQARRRALLAFGGLDGCREGMRDGRGARLFHDAIADCRYAWRGTRRRPGLALAVALTLGIGVGINGFTFGVADSLLFRPIPARDAGQLVGVFRQERDTGYIGSFAYEDYADFRDKSGAFAGIAGGQGVPLNLVAAAAADMVWGEMVTENYFSVLEMTPAVGRFFSAGDAPPGGNPLAVVSYAAWQDRFGGDPAIVGRVIRVNGSPFTITGVAPEGFRGMRALGYWPEIWVPAGMFRTIVPGATSMLEGRGRGWMIAFARMHDGWDLARTSAAADTFARQLARQFPAANQDRGVVLVPASSGFENPQIIDPHVVALSSTLGIVASVMTLLVICANLAGLQLARAAARAREIGIRLSLGCSRLRLVRQLMIETFVLAAPGALIAAAIVYAMPLIEPFMLPRLQFRVGIDMVPNVRVALFTAAVGLLAVVMLGLIPAMRSARARPGLPGTQGLGAAGTLGRRRYGVRGILVVCQLAISVVLLVGAALFARSLMMARAQDVGFDPRDRLLVSVNVGLQGYDEARGRRFYDDVIARVRARPEVISASWAFPVPFDSQGRGVTLHPQPGTAAERGGGLRASASVVAGGFVDAFGLRLVAGRDFDARDTAAAPAVMVVSQSLASRFWPREDPIGKRARIGDASGPELSVVGVVADAKFESLGEVNPRRVYLPLGQRFAGWETLVVHTRGAPRSALPPVLDIVAAADPALPVFGAMTMEEAVASGLASSRTAAAAAAFFGALALLIAAVGLYAVVASSVADRTREIGLRIALGSTPRRVMRHVMAGGARLGVWGLVLGVVGALGLARAMAGLLFGVLPFDPVAFTAVPLTLLVVVLTSTYLPARRAARTEPMSALRFD